MPTPTEPVELGNPQPEICYPTNYLKQVILRLDFAYPLETLNTKLPTDIREIAEAAFPIPEPRKTIGQQFFFSFGSGDEQQQAQKKQKPTQAISWVFHDEKKEKTLEISQNALLTTTTAYSNFATARDEFINIAKVLFHNFPDVTGSRLGMRFINNFVLEEDNPLDWSHYLKPNLIATLGNVPPDGKLMRDVHTTEVRFPECNLRIVSGMVNPDYPAPIRRKDFILDLDAHRDGTIEQNVTLNKLNDFHRRIQEYFEDSITQEMRNHLNA